VRDKRKTQETRSDAKSRSFARNRLRELRNKDDFYVTPHCLTDEFVKAHVMNRWPREYVVADLCCGSNAIGDVMRTHGYRMFEADLLTGYDFLDAKRHKKKFELGIMNPPFRLFNEWVLRCYEVFTAEFALLAPTTYLQGVKRYNSDGTGVYQDKRWYLAHIYTFNRFPTLSDKLRPDGLILTGMQLYSWFVWRLRNPLKRNCTFHHWLDIDQYVLRKNNKYGGYV